MGKSTKSRFWSVRPGYAFSAGVGIGGGVFVFDFLNRQDNTIYGMLFCGVGLAGTFAKGGLTAATAIKGLGKQALIKFVGVGKGAATHSGVAIGQQYSNRKWTEIPVKTPFSADDLDKSNGRVTILGLSIAKVGHYNCYVTASPLLVGAAIAAPYLIPVVHALVPDYFASVPVEVLPQNFDLQVSATVGMWFYLFDIPNAGS